MELTKKSLLLAVITALLAIGLSSNAYAEESELSVAEKRAKFQADYERFMSKGTYSRARGLGYSSYSNVGRSAKPARSSGGRGKVVEYRKPKYGSNTKSGFARINNNGNGRTGGSRARLR